MTTLKMTLPTIALAGGCLLLGSMGGAVAGGMITGANVQNGSLTGADIKANSVRGNRLVSSSVGGGKIAQNSLTGSDINENSLGKVPKASAADIATSATSVADNSITSSSLGTITPRTVQAVIAPATTKLVVSNCLSGETVLHGSTFWNNVVYATPANARDLNTMYTLTNGSGTQSRAYNGTSDTDATYVVTTYCLA